MADTKSTPAARAAAGRRRRLTRQDKRQANRARILRAARKVFGRRGYHGATIEEIADEAGLSNGAIYYNFDSKGDLFLALLEDRMEERVRHMRRTLTGGRPSGRDGGLAEEARDATRSLKESPEWRLLLFEFVAHAVRSPSLRRKLRAHKRKYRAAMAKVLEERLTERGASASIPSEHLALVATALANGLALEEAADPGAVPNQSLGDLLALLIAQGDPGSKAS
jgi:AcrR family transcriptional regulator